MTYSRPGTSQVNANAGAPTTNRVRIAGSSTPLKGAGFSYSDRFVDSRIAGANAGQDQAAISRFLEGIQGPVVKVADAISLQNANNQVGALIANNPDLPELFRTSPESVQDQIRSLSPRAKDIFLRNQAISAATSYEKTLATTAVADALLTQPTTDANRDAQIARYAELKTEALQSSGLNSLPAGYVGAVGTELAQLEGSLQGQLQAARVNQEAAYRGNAEAQFFGDILERNASAIPALNADLGEQVDGTVAAAEDLVVTIQERVAENLNSGNFTPTQTLTRLWQGTSTRAIEAINDGNIDEARQLVDLLEVASKTEIPVGKDGVNFWDLRIPGSNNSSSSLQDKIRSLETAIDTAERQQRDRAAFDFIEPFFDGLISTDPEERAAAEDGFRAALSTLDLSAEVKLRALEIQQNAASRGRQTTADQIDNFAALLGSDEYVDGTSDQRRQLLEERYNSREISQEQYFNGMANLANANTDAKQLDQTIQYAKTSVQNDALSLNATNELGDALVANGIPEGGLEDALLNRLKVIEGRAFTATREEAQRRLDAGETLNDADVREIYRENYKKEAQYIINELKKSAGLEGNSKEKVQAWLRLIEGNIQDDPQGVKNNPMKMFPQTLVEEATRAAVEQGESRANMDWRKVQSYLIGRMAGITEEGSDDSYLFGRNYNDAQQWYRNWYQDVSGDKNPIGVSDSGTMSGAPIEGNFDVLGQPFGDQSSNKNDFDYVSFVLDPLTQLAGAVLPGGGSPAAASSLTENQETMPQLARAYSGREPVSLRTPPLPQVAASTQTQKVPMAITTSNHPFSIAIGIAEGTRTANGGMTKAYYGHRDPGNGASNSGTYSAQQGMAPSQADAYWNGKLTRTAMRVAPLLQAAGIEPGTQGFNRLMFNILDLNVQSPLALETFLPQIPKMIRGGLSVEAIAKARADSFYNPRTGRLEAAGFGNSYQRLFRDQRSRAGVWDYRRRI